MQHGQIRESILPNAMMRRWLVCTALIVILWSSTAVGQITRTMFPTESWNLYDPIITRTTLCDAAALNAALTAIGANTRRLWLSPVNGAGTACTWTIDANVTLPANVTLHVPAGVQISISLGFTLTINGPMQADDEQIISGSAGDINFGDRLDTLKAIWWSGTTLTNATLQTALDDIGAATKILIMTEGTWAISSNVTVPSTLTLVFPVGAACTISGGAVFDVQGAVIDYNALAKAISATQTVANTITATSVGTYTISGCELSTHHGVRILATFDYLNNSGANAQLDIRVVYGATTALLFTTAEIQSSASRRPGWLDVLIVTADSVTAARAGGVFRFGAAVGVTGQSTATLAGLETMSGHNNITDDSTGDVVLNITAQHDVANVNISVTMQSMMVQLLQR